MRALVASGDRLELGRFGPTGDVYHRRGWRHVPLAAAPIAAALGVKVAPMASRGLAHAGGTADKLEAIPGMEVNLSLDRWVRQLRDEGIAVAAHHGRLAPADLRLAGLRDATGTVPAPGVVAASAMSPEPWPRARIAARWRSRARGVLRPDVEGPARPPS